MTLLLRTSPSPLFSPPLPSLRFRNPNPSSLIFSSSSLSIDGRLSADSAAGIRLIDGKGSGDGFSKIEVEDEEEIREVNCEVDVVSWREKRIKASILIAADEEAVWSVLTDYERLAEFIPNLVCSERIPCQHPGRIWLLQKGMQRSLYWHIEARVVLDLQEFPNAEAGKELHFCMVDGDFVKFEGKWSLSTSPRPSSTLLTYEVNVVPRFNYPAIFIERIIRSDMPQNLRAIALRAEKNLKAMDWTIDKCGFDIKSKDGLAPIYADKQPVFLKKDISNLNGQTENSSHAPPMSTSHSASQNNKWGVFGKVCSLDRPCMADEVHLRRCDDLLENGGVHRSVSACITVKATVQRVWNVLTSYETLPEFVPNLAISKILSRENNKVQILQEGCKGLLYMVLHARVVLGLCERYEQEISFEQIEGDFDSFQGKWVLEQLGDQHTLLKYTVESKMQKNSFLSEAIVEEVIYEDLPSNLCALRDRIEEDETLKSRSNWMFPEFEACTGDSDVYGSLCKNVVQVFDTVKKTISREHSKVPGLQKDIEILKSELRKFIYENGQEGFMPMRKHLRLHGRVDLEKAITRMGGFRQIAALMNLSLAYKHRKPKGYWDNLENLREEINSFQISWGMDPSYMPSRMSFERAGRYDLARAFEKWGGLREVARLLSLKSRHPKQLSSTEQKDHEPLADQASYNSEKPSYKSYVSQDTQKWLMTFKHMDINWRE